MHQIFRTLANGVQSGMKIEKFSIAHASVFSWKTIMTGYAVTGLLIGIGIYITFNEKQSDIIGQKDVQFDRVGPFLKNAFRDSELMARTILASSLFVILPLIYGIWWPTYIASYGMNFSDAVLNAQWIAFGIFIGNVFFSVFRMNTSQSNVLFLVLNLVSAILLIMMLSLSIFNSVFFYVSMFVLGFCSSASIVCFADLNERPYQKELLVGFVNTFIVLSAPFFEVFISITMSNANLIFPSMHFGMLQTGLMICPILQLFAFGIGLYLLYPLKIRQFSTV